MERLFHETVDESLLQSCKSFVSTNKSSVHDRTVYKEAVDLLFKLQQSLVSSHKDFDAAVYKVNEELMSTDDDIKKFRIIVQFNQSPCVLRLDKDAHDTWDDLFKIAETNRQ